MLKKQGEELGAKRLAPPIVAAALLVAAALSPLYVSSYMVILFSSIIMYIVLSVSWTMFSGPTGYVSLASAAFFGIGVYVSAILGGRLPLPVLMAVGGLVSFIVAFGMGAITLRLRGVYFTIFTFGLVELLKNLVLWVEIRFAGTRGRFVVSVGYVSVFYCLLGALALLLVTFVIVRRSRFGMALSGIGESEDAAAHIGINTTVTKITAYAISAFWIGAVGSAMATRWGYIDPVIAFNNLMSFMPVLMAIFGGMSGAIGPVIGAVALTYLQEILVTRFPNYYMIIFGAIMVLAILFLPDGIVGLIKKHLRAGKGAAQ
jgi:branched-chain amino acid transport system permease protein